MMEMLEDGKYLAFLATVDEEGRPHLRPLIAIIASKKIYFTTKDGSRKAKEISMNPSCEVVFPFEENERLAYLRVAGETFRIFEEGVKDEILFKAGYNLGEYVNVKEGDTIKMYELLPTSVERFNPNKKVTEDVTMQFLKTNKG